MKAYFVTPEFLLKQSIDLVSKRSEPGIIEFTTSFLDGSNDTIIVVTSEPLPMMALIGQLAAFGDDGLLSANSKNR